MKDEVSKFKVFAAYLANLFNITYRRDIDWHNFCAGLFTYLKRQKPAEWSEEDESAYHRGYFDGFNAGQDFVTEKRVREGSASKCEAVGAVLQKRYNIIVQQIIPRQTDEKLEQWYRGRIAGLVDAMALLDSSEESIRIELEEKK